MNYSEIEIWLKNTILGLIFLGAIGSILAVWLFRLFRFFIRSIKITRSWFLEWEYSKLYAAGYFAGYTRESGNPIIPMVWFTFRIARLLIALFLFLSSLITLLYLLQLTIGTILTLGTLITIIICFLLLRWAYEEYRYIKVDYNNSVLPVLMKAAESMKKRDAKTLQK